MERWIATLSRYDQFWFCWFTHRVQGIQRSYWVRWLSRSGDGYCYAVLALYFSFNNESVDHRMLSSIIVGFAVEIPSFILIKRLLKRPRPYHALPISAVIQAHDQFSFPSGHATAAFLFAIWACYFIPTFTIGWLLWATAVGISRLLLGVHYPGDILAGAVLGSSLAGLALTLVT